MSAQNDRGTPRPTLTEVARVAGVSVGLASMCLTGAPGPAERTREHVREVARRLGYRPDKAASLLARSTIRRIGVVFSLRQALHAQIVEDLYRAALAQKYELLLSAATEDHPARTAAEHLLDSRCQAIILVSSRPQRDAISAAAEQVPVVLLGSSTDSSEVSSIQVNGYSGVCQAVRYLRSAGHTRIVFADAAEALGSTDRLIGYRSAMAEIGLGDLTRIVAGGETFQSGVQAASRLAREPNLPTAVIAHNDECAAGLIFGFKIRGVQVPDEVSVVGFDDSGFAWQSGLIMTTLHQDVTQIAALAVAEATRRIDSAEATTHPAQTRITPTLRIRDSSGPCPDLRLAAVSS
ncbi:LacI family DNA-binding transcriptional regulator [Pseudoclavibacter sp. CFCC 13796]|uniref:LacI family DNA-binding transcriptional regulator n=1 Tax=Pseudoclavibacter sp. CFCC 13796 TaxID=2615179 RepID=UPI0017887396|nr:LacI family DNA-binding transcriptional regulator [Pseudoclavibacter sp. CFCC 13796]